METQDLAHDPTQDALRQRARADDPSCQMTWADLDALVRIDGEGSAAETAAVRRTDVEAWIPGLEARPTVMRMGWTIFAAVLIASALSWLQLGATFEAIVNWTAFGLCTAAVAASVWSILSEMRGWEGSNAAYWFRKGRLKRYRTARAARLRAIAQTLVAVNEATLTVYAMEEGVILPTRYTPDVIRSVALQLGETHMSLHLATATRAVTFDWLRRCAAFETEFDRFETHLRASHTAEQTA